MEQNDIKNDLKTLLLETMIPESQMFIDDIGKEIDSNNASEDDIQASNEMAAFVEELNMIVTMIDEDKISQEDMEVIYQRIMTMIEEHQ